MAELHRDDLPPQLQPLFDQLTLELQRVRGLNQSLATARTTYVLASAAALALSAALVVVLTAGHL